MLREILFYINDLETDLALPNGTIFRILWEILVIMCFFLCLILVLCFKKDISFFTIIISLLVAIIVSYLLVKDGISKESLKNILSRIISNMSTK